MSTALAQRTPSLVDFSDAQIALVKRTLLTPSKRQATDDELALFIGQAKRTGLDPFSRQIYGVFRWDSRSNGEKMTIQASIDGLRLVAERSGHYLGQSGPFWCDEAGDWMEIWPKARGNPIAAKVIVRKLIGGQVAETPAVAHWDEYVQTKKDGNPTQMWAEKSALMLAKCAEALALRKAFPNDLSGLYTAEEMAKADTPAQPAPVAVPAPRPGFEQWANVADPIAGEAVSDIPNDWPPKAAEPATKPEAVDADSALMVDEMFAVDIAGEFKRQALKVGDFRDILTSVGVELPEDLRSAEARREVLKGLTLDQAIQVTKALKTRSDNDTKAAA